MSYKVYNYDEVMYNYKVDMFQAALKIQAHCKVQHKYHKGCRDCCFADRTNDDLLLLDSCPLSAARPELWDVSEGEVKMMFDSHTYINDQVQKYNTEAKADVKTPIPNMKYRWISWGRDSAYNKYYRCSCCNHEIMLDDMCDPELPKTCEHCGAKMTEVL